MMHNQKFKDFWHFCRRVLILVLIVALIFGDGSINRIFENKMEVSAESAENNEAQSQSVQPPVVPSVAAPAATVTTPAVTPTTASAQAGASSSDDSSSKSSSVAASSASEQGAASSSSDTAEKAAAASTASATAASTTTAATEEDAQKLITLTTMAGGYTIKVAGTKAALGKAVSVSATLLTDARLQEIVNENPEIPDDAVVNIGFDVTLHDEAGGETQPDGQVSVTMENIVPEVLDGEPKAETADIKLYHIIEEKDTVETPAVSVDGNALSVDVNHFSEIVPVLLGATSTIGKCTITGTVKLNDADWKQYIHPTDIEDGYMLKLTVNGAATSNSSAGDNYLSSWTGPGEGTDTWTYTIKNVPYSATSQLITVALAGINSDYTVNHIAYEYSAASVAANAPSSAGSTETITIPQMTAAPVTQKVLVAQTVVPSSTTAAFAYQLKVGVSAADATHIASTLNLTGDSAATQFAKEIPRGIFYQVTGTTASGYADPELSSNKSGQIGTGTKAADVTVTAKQVGKTDFSWKTIWCDNNNQEGYRVAAAAAAKYTLFYSYQKDGTTVTKELSTATMADLGLTALPTATKTENSYSTWTYTDKGLPACDIQGNVLTYYVKESTVPDHYAVQYDESLNNAYASATVYNMATKSFGVSVKWQDAATYQETRPDKVYLVVYNASAAGDPAVEMMAVSSSDSDVAVSTDTATGIVTWKKTISGLPAYGTDANPITYYVKEYQTQADAEAAMKAGTAGEGAANKSTSVAGSYTYKYDNGTGKYGNITDRCYEEGSVMNQYSALTSFSVKKVWKDDGSDTVKAGRPTAVLTLWRYTQKGINTYQDGAAVYLNNTFVTKNLTLADNEETVVMGQGADGSALLPVYDNNGYPYVYFVKEVLSGTNSANYKQSAFAKDGTTSVSYAGNDGILWNVPSQNVDITVEKTWIAAARQSMLGNVNITIQLKRFTKQADGTEKEDENFTKESHQASTTKGFSKVSLTQDLNFNDLPRYDNAGNQYIYKAYENISASDWTVKQPTLLDADSTAANTFDLTRTDSTGAYTYYDTYEFSSKGYTVTSEGSGDAAGTIHVSNILSGKINYILKKIWNNNGLAQPAGATLILHQRDYTGADVTTGGWPKNVLFTKSGTSYVTTVTAGTGGTSTSGTFSSETTAKVYTDQDTGKTTDYTDDVWTDDTDFTGTDNALPAYDADGNPYSYYVTEGTTAGYYHYFSYATTNDQKTITATVSNIHPTKKGGHTVYVYVTKNWMDGGDTSDRLPVTVQLAEVDTNGKIVTNHTSGWTKPLTLTIDSKDGWKGYMEFSSDEYPLSSEDNKYYAYETQLGVTTGSVYPVTYKDVSENNVGSVTSKVLGYNINFEVAVTGTGSNDGGDYTMTNTRVGKIDFVATKVWKDGGRNNSERPNIKLQLWQRVSGTTTWTTVSDKYYDNSQSTPCQGRTSVPMNRVKVQIRLL